MRRELLIRLRWGAGRVRGNVIARQSGRCRCNGSDRIVQTLSDPIGVERLLSPGSAVQWIRSEPPQWSQIGQLLSFAISKADVQQESSVEN